MKILVISSHPDDLEIGCGGTVARFQDQGHEVISVITVRPSIEDRPGRTKDITESELKNSMSIAGIEYRVFETDLYDNGRPNLCVNNVTMSRLAELLEPCDLAILPHARDSHQDHRATFELALPLMLRRAKTIWSMHSWPYCYQHAAPNLFRDITDYWPVKENMLKCYSSYFIDDDIQQIRNLNRVWGDQSGVRLAEAFSLVIDRG